MSDSESPSGNVKLNCSGINTVLSKIPPPKDRDYLILDIAEPPSGWFVLDVMRQQERKGDWTAALMVDVDPSDLKFCACDFPARFYVHPNDYQPAEGRPARQCFVSIPGKHRSRKDAWKALHDLLEAKLH